jgi:SAM-dependent methyltransferase
MPGGSDAHQRCSSFPAIGGIAVGPDGEQSDEIPVAVPLIPGQLADFVERIQGCMALGLWQREQIVLKHRVVQVEPDLGFTARQACYTRFDFNEGPMSDWTSGYVADIGYTYGYYTELNPLRARLAFINAGLLPPEVGTACELGFGQGMSANLHAAASVVQWHGTDFNPSQASFAQELARVADAGARLFDESFEQFCRRDDLPGFDYIGLHGIWSWISDANRAVIVDFVRRKLKVGGVLYISYNTQPGWAAMVPMRDLLTEHAEVLGADGAGIVSRIDSALAFADQLLAANPAYARANPQIAERLKRIKDQNRHYVAHEYFNRDWQPMAFAQMGRWLESAKLQFACSTNWPTTSRIRWRRSNRPSRPMATPLAWPSWCKQ